MLFLLIEPIIVLCSFIRFIWDTFVNYQLHRMYSFFKKLFGTLVSFLTFGCFNFQKDTIGERDIVKEIELSKGLEEISGIFYQEPFIYAQQDEKAVIYQINTETNEKQKLINIDKLGDYEDITLVDNLFYLMQSDGSILEIKDNNNFKEYPSDFSKLEFEGMCLSNDKKDLILAVKDLNRQEKEIILHSFHLATKTFSSTPYLIIDKNANDIDKDFKPSGIVQLPNNNFYIISSVSKEFIEITASGELVKKLKLDKKLFPQAEGLSLGKTGFIYISNEKTKKDASLYEISVEKFDK